MGVQYVGELPLGVLAALSLEAVASASASLTLALAPLAIELEAAVQCGISLTLSPPSIGVDLAFCVQLLIDLNLALSVSLPSLDFQITAVLALIAQLSPLIASISASLTLTLPLAELFATAGIEAYSYSGTGANFGSTLQQAVGVAWPDGTSSATEVTAFVLASTKPSTWSGMQDFFTILPATQPDPSMVYLGGISIGAMCGGLSSGILDANLSLNLQLGSLEAQLSAAFALKASLTANPPSIAGSITLVTQLKASLEAYLTLGGFALPTVAIQAIADLVINIGALTAKITAQVSALASITAALGTTGVLVYKYTGTGNDIGSMFNASVGGGWPDGTEPNLPSNALVLACTASVAAAGLSAFFVGA